MTLMPARTVAEAHAYMAMTPCAGCGERGVTPPNTGVVEVDGELASEYSGACPRCGETRGFKFRMPPDRPPPDREEPTFGAEQPSELLDAGQWLWYADRLTAGLPAEPTRQMTAQQRRQARARLLRAAAAVAEAIKFVPEGAEAVPAGALWSPLGQTGYAQRPGHFDRERLEVLRRSCREAAARFQTAPARGEQR